MQVATISVSHIKTLDFLPKSFIFQSEEISLNEIDESKVYLFKETQRYYCDPISDVMIEIKIKVKNKWRTIFIPEIEWPFIITNILEIG